MNVNDAFVIDIRVRGNGSALGGELLNCIPQFVKAVASVGKRKLRHHQEQQYREEDLTFH